MVGRKLNVKNGVTILFQGDSITDAGRDREKPDGLGHGYVSCIEQKMAGDVRFSRCRVINKGISGNRVADLQARWQKDCLDLKPDVLSVLIGVNDTWRRFDSNSYTPPEEYYNGFKDILTRALAANKGLQIVILEPFLIPSDPALAHMRIDLDAKIEAARRVSLDLNACYVPFDGIFAAACTLHPPAYWSHDGVHPTPEGHKLMAEAFMGIIGA